jgi:hypothetical protein
MVSNPEFNGSRVLGALGIKNNFQMV